MYTIKQKLKDLRPALREVAPLTYYICIGFAVLNVVLGITLINTHGPTGLSIVGTYTPIWGYGILFLLLGILGLGSLYANNWVWIRRTLVLGMLYKSIWFYALVASLFHGGSFAILGLWLFLIHVQAMTYVYFIPNIHRGKLKNVRPTNI